MRRARHQWQQQCRANSGGIVMESIDECHSPLLLRTATISSSSSSHRRCMTEPCYLRSYESNGSRSTLSRSDCCFPLPTHSPSLSSLSFRPSLYDAAHADIFFAAAEMGWGRGRRYEGHHAPKNAQQHRIFIWGAMTTAYHQCCSTQHATTTNKFTASAALKAAKINKNQEKDHQQCSSSRTDSLSRGQPLLLSSSSTLLPTLSSSSSSSSLVQSFGSTDRRQQQRWRWLPSVVPLPSQLLRVAVHPFVRHQHGRQQLCVQQQRRFTHSSGSSDSFASDIHHGDADSPPSSSLSPSSSPPLSSWAELAFEMLACMENGRQEDFDLVTVSVDCAKIERWRDSLAALLLKEGKGGQQDVVGNGNGKGNDDEKGVSFSSTIAGEGRKAHFANINETTLGADAIATAAATAATTTNMRATSTDATDVTANHHDHDHRITTARHHRDSLETLYEPPPPPPHPPVNVIVSTDAELEAVFQSPRGRMGGGGMPLLPSASASHLSRVRSGNSYQNTNDNNRCDGERHHHHDAASISSTSSSSPPPPPPPPLESWASQQAIRVFLRPKVVMDEEEKVAGKEEHEEKVIDEKVIDGPANAADTNRRTTTTTRRYIPYTLLSTPTQVIGEAGRWVEIIALADGEEAEMLRMMMRRNDSGVVVSGRDDCGNTRSHLDDSSACSPSHHETSMLSSSSMMRISRRPIVIVGAFKVNKGCALLLHNICVTPSWEVAKAAEMAMRVGNSATWRRRRRRSANNSTAAALTMNAPTPSTLLPFCEEEKKRGGGEGEKTLDFEAVALEMLRLLEQRRIDSKGCGGEAASSSSSYSSSLSSSSSFVVSAYACVEASGVGATAYVGSGCVLAGARDGLFLSGGARGVICGTTAAASLSPPLLPIPSAKTTVEAVPLLPPPHPSTLVAFNLRGLFEGHRCASTMVNTVALFNTFQCVLLGTYDALGGEEEGNGEGGCEGKLASRREARNNTNFGVTANTSNNNHPYRIHHSPFAVEKAFLLRAPSLYGGYDHDANNTYDHNHHHHHDRGGRWCVEDGGSSKETNNEEEEGKTRRTNVKEKSASFKSKNDHHESNINNISSNACDDERLGVPEEAAAAVAVAVDDGNVAPKKRGGIFFSKFLSSSSSSPPPVPSPPPHHQSYPSRPSFSSHPQTASPASAGAAVATLSKIHKYQASSHHFAVEGVLAGPSSHVGIARRDQRMRFIAAVNMIRGPLSSSPSPSDSSATSPSPSSFSSSPPPSPSSTWAPPTATVAQFAFSYNPILDMYEDLYQRAGVPAADVSTAAATTGLVETEGWEGTGW